jgi:hypothetical protein
LASAALTRTSELRHGLDVVDDVVQLLGQRVDVLAVEGGDEARVEPPEDRVGELVALPLALVDRGVLRLDVLILVEQVTQPAGTVGQVLGGLVEQWKETLVGGNEAKAHGDPRGQVAMG